MKIYKISCHSVCGTHFGAYLQSLIIIADSPEKAKEYSKKWQRRNQSFIYPEDEWMIEELSGVENSVIDYHVDSDY